MYEDEKMLQLAKRHPEVDFYIDSLPNDRKQALQVIRELIHKSVPNVMESMQYRMPTFVTTAIITAMASQKRHIALYICNTDILDAHRDQLSHLKVGRSCVRFNRLDELPLDTIGTILKNSEAFLQAWLGNEPA